MRNQLLFKNSLIYISFEVFNKSLPFLLLPVFTRFLNVEEFGTLSLFLTFVNVVFVTTGIGVSGAVTANFFRLSPKDFSIYIGNSIIVVLVAFGINMLIITFIGIFSQSFDLSMKWLLFGGLIAFSRVVQLIYLSVLRMEHKALSFGKFQFSVTFIDALASVLGIVFFSMGWEFRANVMLVISVGAAFFSLYILKKEKLLSFILKPTFIKDILNFGFPLLPHQLGLWARTGADRFIIAIILTKEAVGIYSAVFQLGFGLAIVMQAFNQAYQPLLYKELSDGATKGKKREIVKRTYVVFILVIFLSFLLALLLPLFIPVFLGNDKYLEGLKLIPWLVLGACFHGMYLVLVLFILYSKKTYLLSIITIMSALVHLSVSYFLVSINGIIGAAQATSISFALAFVLTFILSNKIYPLPWIKKK